MTKISFHKHFKYLKMLNNSISKLVPLCYICFVFYWNCCFHQFLVTVMHILVACPGGMTPEIAQDLFSNCGPTRRNIPLLNFGTLPWGHRGICHKICPNPKDFWPHLFMWIPQFPGVAGKAADKCITMLQAH